MRRITRMGRSLAAIAGLLGTLIALAGASPAAFAGPAWDYTQDILYVAYVPGGNEIIVNLGPKTQFTSATGPVVITRFSAQDLRNVLNAGVPIAADSVWVSIFGIRDETTFNSYFATNGPTSLDPITIGNAFGAANQIFGFGSNVSQLASPVTGNPNAGQYAGAYQFSYQNTLNGTRKGSLGGNVPFDSETLIGAGSKSVPFFFGSKTSAGAIAQGLVGVFTLATDGTLIFNIDTDGDGIPAWTDNCPSVYNPAQTDADLDGFGAACDCNDGDRGVHAIPGEVPALTIAADKATLSWTPPLDPGGSSTVYDLVRSTSKSDFASAAATCVATGVGGTTASDATAPASGLGSFYLVRGRNSCGLGSAGKTSANAEINVRLCP